MPWDAVKKAKKRLERERGTVSKDWGGRLPIALVYPNSYFVGMSNLGLQTLYGLLNSYPGVVCERVFYEVGPPLSLESQRPLGDFALLAFSISYELDYLNVLELLKSGGIPLLAADRDERHPLVIAGGPCIIANPEPLSPFFDCFAIGEGEVILPPMLPVLLEEGRRDELLRELARLPGLYVPLLRNGLIARQWARDLGDFATTSTLLTPDTELGEMYLIEVARGCGRGCRFCLAGYAFRPPRPRPLRNLLSQGEEGLKLGGRLGLVGAAISDHPDLEELVAQLRQRRAAISVSSLRVDNLSEVVLEALAGSGTRTVTLAPEAGSERLRQVINKGVAEEDILAAVAKVARYGVKQLKLYFMIGLPTETDEDVEGLVRLALACKERLDRGWGGTQLIINVTPFVPKAGTPFQWLPMEKAEVLERRLSLLREVLPRKGIELRAESVAWAAVQGALSRGDSRLGEVLLRMTENSLSAWRRALEECSLDAAWYVYRELPLEGPLPWGALDSGVARDYLAGELEGARRGAQTPPCPPANCHLCGVC